jgi:alkylation response protein AidB-like acyl-CoA dehydrogenase
VAIDLSWNERQLALQPEAHQLFSEQCQTGVIREIETGEVGYQPELWRDIAGRGWLGLTFPAALGGGPGGHGQTAR